MLQEVFIRYSFRDWHDRRNIVNLLKDLGIFPIKSYSANQPATVIMRLKAQIMATPVTRCDEVAFSLFGISMAGYNLLFCLVLAGFAARTLLRARGKAVPA